MRLVGKSDPVSYRLLGRITRAPEPADFYTVADHVVVRWHVTLDGRPRQTQVKSLTGVVPVGFRVVDFVGTGTGLNLIATDGHQVRALRLEATRDGLRQTTSWVMLHDGLERVGNVWAANHNGLIHVFFETTTVTDSYIRLAKYREKDERDVTQQVLRTRQDGLSDRLILLDRPAVLDSGVAYGFIEERAGHVTVSLCVMGAQKALRRVWVGDAADLLTGSMGGLSADSVFFSVEGQDTFEVFKVRGSALVDAGTVPIPDTCVRTRGVGVGHGRAVLLSEDLTTQTLMTVIDVSSDKTVVVEQNWFDKDYGFTNRLVALDHNVAMLLDAEDDTSRIAVLSDRLSLQQRSRVSAGTGRYLTRKRSLAR